MELKTYKQYSLARGQVATDFLSELLRGFVQMKPKYRKEIKSAIQKAEKKNPSWKKEYDSQIF